MVQFLSHLAGKEAERLFSQFNPLRVANDHIIKPLVYGASKKYLGAGNNEIQLADDIFESLYSVASLDPVSALSNVYKTADDYRIITGKKPGSVKEFQIMKSSGPDFENLAKLTTKKEGPKKLRKVKESKVAVQMQADNPLKEVTKLSAADQERIVHGHRDNLNAQEKSLRDRIDNHTQEIRQRTNEDFKANMQKRIQEEVQ